MSKPPLTRPSWWDADLARDLLKERVATTAHLGGARVRLSGEPLLRHDGRGGLLQSVRLRVDHPDGTRPPRLTRARVTTAGGTPVHCELLPGPDGDTRLLVPEVTAPTPCRSNSPNSRKAPTSPSRHTRSATGPCTSSSTPTWTSATPTRRAG